jgi:hypothetical protein
VLNGLPFKSRLLLAFCPFWLETVRPKEEVFYG